MILEINDPGWDFTSMFVTGGIVLVIIGVLVYLSVRFSDRMSEGSWFGLWTMVGVVSVGAIFGLGGISVGNSIYTSAVKDAKVAGLEELGFKRITLSGSNFTADRDGAYFEGLLIEDGDLRWEVAELLPPVILEEEK